MLVYIISARGPYPEKAVEERFWLIEEEAQEKCALLNKEMEKEPTIAKPIFSVYPMVLEAHTDE